MTEFYNLSHEEIGVGFSNNILFVFTLGYIANAIYFTSLYQILKAKGRPRWALVLHILFPLFLIGFQIFAYGVGEAMKGFQL